MDPRNRRAARPLVLGFLLAALLTPTAEASHRGHRPPPYDFVRGAGENIFTVHFAIAVRSGPDGERPTGTFRYRVPGLPAPFVNDGRPSCLRVAGDQATIGGELRRPVATPAGPAGAVLITVTDRSRRPGGQDGVTVWPVAGPPSVCPPPTPVPDDAVTEGGVVVHDGRTQRPAR